MKTSTKILLAGGATLAVGAYAYRMGVNHVQFSLDGYQPAPDGAGLLMRIKATNPNKFFGYPVPQALINVFDNNSNFLGTAINNQLQYIPANSTSFIYAVVQPNYQNLVSVILGIISSGTLPTNLIFNGLVKVGPVQIPFDTGASIAGIGATTEPVTVNMDDQILFDRPNSLIVCRVTEIREKAVKVDYELMPISAYSGSGAPTVYSYTCWIPKSVLIHDKYKELTVKKWFAKNWQGGYRIKPYFIQDGKKVLV